MSYCIAICEDHSPHSRALASWVAHLRTGRDAEADAAATIRRAEQRSHDAEVEPVVRWLPAYESEPSVVHVPEGAPVPTGGYRVMDEVYVIRCTHVPVGTAYRIIGPPELEAIARRHAASPPQSPDTRDG